MFAGKRKGLRRSQMFIETDFWVREIKKSSNTFIKNKKFTSFSFQWQEGYGAFSYSHSQLTDLIRYIKDQKKHHKKRTFKEEYLSFLNAFEIEFKDEYLFNWIDNE